MTRRCREFYTFRAAASYASEMAAANRACVRLQRNGQFWRVIPAKNFHADAGCDTHSGNNGEDRRSAGAFDEAFDDPIDSIVRTELDELLDDLSDDVRNYARSEEEGWYYEDSEQIRATDCHSGTNWYYDPGFGGWFQYNFD